MSSQYIVNPKNLAQDVAPRPHDESGRRALVTWLEQTVAGQIDGIYFDVRSCTQSTPSSHLATHSRCPLLCHRFPAPCLYPPALHPPYRQVYGSCRSGFHSCDSDIDLSLSAASGSNWAKALQPVRPGATLEEVVLWREARLQLLRCAQQIRSAGLPAAGGRSRTRCHPSFFFHTNCVLRSMQPRREAPPLAPRLQQRPLPPPRSRANHQVHAPVRHSVRHRRRLGRRVQEPGSGPPRGHRRAIPGSRPPRQEVGAGQRRERARKRHAQLLRPLAPRRLPPPEGDAARSAAPRGDPVRGPPGGGRGGPGRPDLGETCPRWACAGQGGRREGSGGCRGARAGFCGARVRKRQQGAPPCAASRAHPRENGPFDAPLRCRITAGAGSARFR